MNPIGRFLPQFLTPWDLAALAVFFGCMFAMGRLIERSPDSRPSTARIMAYYRRRWMQEVPNRSNRVVSTPRC